MRNKLVKELIIIFLLLVVIVFAMGILFYDSTAENVEEILSVQYSSSKEVNEVLNEIKAKGGENIEANKADSLLKSYSINADDLSKFASEKYYESGKKDPFAEFSETIEEHTTTTMQSGNATQAQSSNPLTNTITKNETNTISNTNINKVNNTIKNTVTTNTVSNNTNTIKNTNTTTNSLTTNKKNESSKDKNESSSNKGTFFENKNSK